MRTSTLRVGGLLAMAAAATIGQPLPAAVTGPDVDRLLTDAEAAFAGRADPTRVVRARELFRSAARADEARTEGLLGAMRAIAWLVEHEPDGSRREAMVAEGVQLGQWCEQRAPDSSECAFRLALAVGQQARERPATAHDGLQVMVERLERVAAAAPDLDAAGPERVLALVRLRAPGWPAGPGDPEAALEDARRAAGRVGTYPPNLMVLAEALVANGRSDEARTAYQRALALAEARVAAGDPDAEAWHRDIVRALATLR